MKVALVVHTAYPDFIGGREHHVHYLASRLSQTDEVVVIAGGKTGKIQERKISGYRLITLPMISIKVSRNPLQIYRIIWKLFPILKIEKPDLIHAFEYGSYSTDVTYLYSKKYNIPFMITVYGYQFKNPILKFLKIVYNYFIGRKLYEEASGVFYSSEAQYREILGVIRKDIRSKIVFQENCIPVNNFKYAVPKQDLLKSYNLHDNEIKLLTVLRILPRKGLRYLVLALEKIIKENHLGKIKLLIVGPDCGELKNIKTMVKKAKLKNNIIIVGPVAPHRIKDFLGIADIFVLPSLYEALPLALLEAMAAGKAVIFTSLPCAKKVIIDEKDGLLVKPADVDSLKRAIYRLCCDKELRQRLGYNARKKAINFDYQIEATKLRQVYTKILLDKVEE
ncbi:MAG: glycosyltransferase family 4 protein [Candidatus Omnitrophica bacterium]|nr:glycosyltransferase family 4 protein [Candidatus Omnitrophota bacterium]